MENAENALDLLYDVCRLCLDEPGVENIYKPVDWAKDILKYTGVKVTASDKLPQTICTSCRDIIACVKVLKDIATTNDEQLQLIRGSKKNQVLVTDSPSHLVIITPRTAYNNQDEFSEVPEITSNASDKSLKDKIVFESEEEVIQSSKTKKHQKKKKSFVFKSEDEETKAQREERHQKKRKTSSSKTEIHNPPIKLSVRTDLFESSGVVTSSTKQIKQITQPSTSSPTKMVTTSPEKKNKESPSSTTGHSNAPKKIKILKVGGQEFKVFGYDYKCETCNKSYATHKKLYLHLLAHNKKFMCPLDACCKKFATKGDLQKHIRSHTGEKPYKCDLCDQSFTQNVSLKAHKEKIHVEQHN